jgi:hypothetical protein
MIDASAMERLHPAQLYWHGCCRARGLLSRGRVSYFLDGAEGLDSYPSRPTWSWFYRTREAERGHAPRASYGRYGGIMSGRKRLAYLTRIHIIELVDSHCSGLI